MCFRHSFRAKLKKHLITVHQVVENKASTARINFKLNAQPTRLPKEYRLTKPRLYKTKRWPFIYYQVVLDVQKQPPEVFCKKVFLEIWKILRKTPVPESLLIKLQAA